MSLSFRYYTGSELYFKMKCVYITPAYLTGRFYPQLYLQRNSDSITSATNASGSCIAEVSHWMSADRLKLDEVKKELIWIVGPDHQKVVAKLFNLVFGN